MVFTSSEPDSLNGDDWAGITIRGDAWNGDGLGVAHIKDAEIAFASYPLTFFEADTAEVRNSWFHHYHEEAIVDFASDAAIVGNTIWRGLGLDTTDPIHNPVGRVGIHLASTFGPDSLNVVYHQMQRGIWADFNSGSCSGPLVQIPVRTLTLRKNAVIGDVADFSQLDASGIDVSWGCRYQDVEVEDCNVHDWPTAGIKVRQSSDVGVRCNCVQGNTVGVLHRRDQLAIDSTKSDGYNVLGENFLRENTSANMKTWYKGPTGEPGRATAGIYGGGYTHPLRGTSGSNLLELYLGNTTNWRLDAAQSRTDVAQSNGWKDNFGNPLSDSVAVQQHNFYVPENEQTIELANLLQSAPEPACQTNWTQFCEAPPSPPGGAMIARRPVGNGPGGHASASTTRADGQEASATLSAGDLPKVLALLPPRPNPTQGDGVVMVLEVPAADAGRAEIKVYDVAGRRVRTLLSGDVEPGRREVAWDLRDGRGDRVSSGIYFARMELREKHAIRRIVVLK
ncbi:MAG: FlgD immunoglobulin-like domain containing protein [bacterium]